MDLWQPWIFSCDIWWMYYRKRSPLLSLGSFWVNGGFPPQKIDSAASKLLIGKSSFLASEEWIFSGRSARLTIGIHPWKLNMNPQKSEASTVQLSFWRIRMGWFWYLSMFFSNLFHLPWRHWQVDARFNRCLCQSTFVGSGGDDAFGVKLGALSARTGHLGKNMKYSREV